MKRKILSVAAMAGAAALALTGCAGSPDAQGSPEGTESTTLTFRMWDETVAKAYEKSFAAFEEENPEITVDVNIVPWGSYWTKLRTDIAGGNVDDVFWINDANFAAYADSGRLLDIGTTLGENASQGWQDSVVKQFTRGNSLWGVPQLYDGGIVTYYNEDLIAASGVTPEQLGELAWSPAGGEEDTYLATMKTLARDAAGVDAATEGFDGNPVQYANNISNDLQAILLPFIGSNGGSFQDGDDFSFAGTKSTEAVKYLVDAVNTAKVAPPAADTNPNGDFARDAFIEGKMATFQSGVYNLKNISDGAEFGWGITSIPSGPEGRVSVTNGLAAAGSSAAAKEKLPAIKKLLAWMGSEKGATYLGVDGTAIPGVVAAQKSFFDFWEKQGVDTDPFFDVVDGKTTIPAPTGANFTAGNSAFTPIFQEIFAGTVDPKDGLKKAQDAANAAIAG